MDVHIRLPGTYDPKHPQEKCFSHLDLRIPNLLSKSFSLRQAWMEGALKKYRETYFKIFLMDARPPLQRCSICFLVVPFFMYVGLQRAATPESVYYGSALHSVLSLRCITATRPISQDGRHPIPAPLGEISIPYALIWAFARSLWLQRERYSERAFYGIRLDDRVCGRRLSIMADI
jgi:hypothetical protein